jgi:divalent metal cation (Fe/Co/Zn/Cd) transporter
VTHEPRWDAMGSIAIGILLGAIATLLAIEMKSMLIGEAAEPGILEAVTGAIANCPEVSKLIHLRTLQLGPDDLLVAAKVEMAVEPANVPAAIDVVEVRIRTVVPMHCLIFLEPDVYVEAH